jgi:ketosteroid isomerase-like protein
MISIASLGVAALAAFKPAASAADSSPPRTLRMEEAQVAAFHEMTRAVNAGDAARYARLYAADAVITIIGGGQLNGRSAIEEYEVDLLRQFPGTRLAFYDIWQKGPLAVVRYGVNGRTTSGQVMGHEGLLFYQFDPSGLIEKERRYNDSLTPMAQLGFWGKVPMRAPPTLPTEPKVHVAQGSRAEVENVAAAKVILTALDSKNEAAFLSAVADDAIVNELMLPQPFVGKQNVKAWFEAWTGAVPDAASQTTNITGIEDFVFVESTVRGTLRRPLGLLPDSSNQFTLHRAAVLQVKAGKLIHCSFFMNGKELAEATGQWPLPTRK